MITEFDEFPIHQTSDPIAMPATSDRNAYDRYWFNGSDERGGFVFEVGFGLYPNRFVQDGHLSVLVDGVQHSFHASGRAPLERAETRVGPLRIEAPRPLRVVRVVLEPNETGIACDLTFRAVSVALEEPKNRLTDGTRVLMENSRFTQFGRWDGHFVVSGVRREVRAATTFGTRDRSWGVRPVGEPEAGAPGRLSRPGVYWVWAPLHFDDLCTHYGTFQDPDGRPTQLSACLLPRHAALEAIPRGEEPGLREMAEMRHEIRWRKGTRWPERAALHFVSREGDAVEIELEPMTRFHLHGIGYQHPQWGHGCWRGELATGAESWRIDELDPLAPQHVHCHTICRARLRDAGREREGFGLLETIAFGPHAPSGFRGLLDGAP
jgi:hypothetical protein